MLRVNNLTGFGRRRGGGAIPWEIAYLDNQFQSSNPNGATFSGLNFGAEDANRFIIVVATIGGNVQTLSSITIGGVAGDVLVTTGANNNGVAIAVAKVPTGISGAVVPTWSGNGSRGSIVTLRALGATDPDFAAYATGIASSGTLSVAAPDNGYVLYAFEDGDNVGTVTGADGVLFQSSGWSSHGVAVAYEETIAAATLSAAAGSPRCSCGSSWGKNP